MLGVGRWTWDMGLSNRTKQLTPRRWLFPMKNNVIHEGGMVLAVMGESSRFCLAATIQYQPCICLLSTTPVVLLLRGEAPMPVAFIDSRGSASVDWVPRPTSTAMMRLVESMIGLATLRPQCQR